MEGLPENIILKALGVFGGVVLLAYANHFSMKFHQKEFERDREERDKKEKKIDETFIEAFGKIEDIKVNTIKNCTDIKHLDNKIDKLENRCYERHSE